MIKRTTTHTAVNQTPNLKETSTQSASNPRVKQRPKPDAYVPARIPHSYRKFLEQWGRAYALAPESRKADVKALFNLVRIRLRQKR